MLDLSYLIKDLLPDKTGITYNSNEYKIVVERVHEYIDSDQLLLFLSKVKYLLDRNPKAKKIIFIINGRMFGDDAVILYFELAIKLLFEYGYKDIIFRMPEYAKNSATAALFDMSIIKYCMNSRGKINSEKFLSYYSTMIVDENTNFAINAGYINKELLRLIVVNDGFSKTASRVGTMVYDYLFNQYENGQLLFSEEYIDAAVNIIVEIMDNTLCHTKSDCVFSMKVCDLNNKGKRKFMLSITLSNFDSDVLSAHIINQFENNTLKADTKKKIDIALEHHKKYFDDVYDYNCFALVSAFQKGITTRSNAKNDSGRGLTKFLKSLLIATSVDSCYVYSGNNLIFFNNRNMKVNSEGLIGFNDSCNYLSDIPNKNNIRKMKYYNNGTLFNLMMVYDKEENIK